MEVICISGKAESGKDTVATMMKEYFESKGKKIFIIHYADLLKFICKQYFSWNGEKDEAGRSLLQHIGTDVFRKRDKGFWVNHVISILKIIQNGIDYALIPDCRFMNEITQPSLLFKTHTIYVDRFGHRSSLSQRQQNHESETALENFEFDICIDNNRGLEELKVAVERTCQVIEDGGVE